MAIFYRPTTDPFEQAQEGFIRDGSGFWQRVDQLGLADEDIANPQPDVLWRIFDVSAPWFLPSGLQVLRPVMQGPGMYKAIWNTVASDSPAYAWKVLLHWYVDGAEDAEGSQLYPQQNGIVEREYDYEQTISCRFAYYNSIGSGPMSDHIYAI